MRTIRSIMRLPLLRHLHDCDNFHGAFLYCLTQKWDLDRTLRFCNAFSGLTCQGLGGLAAEPTLEETLQKMEE